jgi:RNase_H superfamily
MRKQMPQAYQIQMDQAIERSINLLSVISPHIYFPTYSNSLKDIGSYLGSTWLDPFVTGVQSRVLRERWIASRDDSLKNKLIQYNLDDCVALQRATEYVEQVIADGECTRSSMENAIPFVSTDTLPKRESYKPAFGKPSLSWRIWLPSTNVLISIISAIGSLCDPVT